MRNFACTNCGNEVFFENVTCLQCDHALGFDPIRNTMVALEAADEASFRAIGDGEPSGQKTDHVTYCDNRQHDVCNWLRPTEAASGLCLACALNRTIPNLAEQGSLAAWRELELAKKRLIYSLLRFGLPMDGTKWNKGRLAFDFVRNARTGHLNGVITIDIAEADTVERVRQREHFGESYRSLLGHLRHESGHFYWTILVEAAGQLEEFRALFGDERQDYGQALARYHESGPPPGWQEQFISAYASSHPWEDWAETWALYLHVVDGVDTANAEAHRLRAAGMVPPSSGSKSGFDAYRASRVDTLIDRWLPLTIAMNSLCRSMGHEDFYTFVIPAAVDAKLAFVHRLVRRFAPQPAG
ncbi:zinc-binding metallopeptidase family protein [Bradyrhizobium sp.]|uniref:zinc-binding metallopeptidase family protein n=1 Tax=Bradyrhizobium sp. TaxID=376 RepID=UPI001DBE6AE8|nr:putative zinc-binding peptidase [Bradyrhizobium sp.]MBV8699698.1 putative zinc-binding peptidase [Bradyrhizobium sp.]MBV8923582.1 putative zinc-binding peptidase [Bradyrhizobium sp.]MBV9985496.1 putative zinc-binding peptidase [Bradyrhizobium sp.]